MVSFAQAVRDDGENDGQDGSSSYGRQEFDGVGSVFQSQGIRPCGPDPRTYAAKRASQARAVATANGRRTGRPSVVDADKLEHAPLLRASVSSVREISARTGLKRTTLDRHLPPPSASAGTESGLPRA